MRGSACGRPGSGVGATGAVLAAALLLAGCSDGGPRADAAGARPPEASGPPAASPAAVSLDPCPEASAEPVPGGLPSAALACLGDEGAEVVDPARLARDVPTVVNVWASWCGPCADEMPGLAALEQVWGPRVRVLGVLYQDAGDGWEDLVARTGADYPSVTDPDGSWARRAGLRGPPLTLFVGADGTVAGRVSGALDAPSLARQVEELLGVPAPDAAALLASPGPGA